MSTRIELPPAGAAEPLLAVFDEPRVEYLDGTREANDAASSTWQRVGSPSWRWCDGACEVALDAGGGADGCARGQIRLQLQALRPVRVRRAFVEVRLPCDGEALCVDAALRWRPASDAVILNGLTPLVVRFHAGRWSYELRSMSGGSCAVVGSGEQWLRVALILDAASLHPRWSFVDGGHRSRAAPQWEVGQTVAVCVRLYAMGAARTRSTSVVGPVPVVAARLPAGAEAVLTITDHCDFDTSARLSTFLRGCDAGPGWSGRGLRYTKGVFTLRSEAHESGAAAPSLEDPEYAAHIRALHADGSEIVPHGVNERGNVEPAVFRDALARLADAFHPLTWIDHGNTLHHAYSMGGSSNAYDLLGELRRHGITTLWSYNDLPVVAAGSLNMLAPERRDGVLTAQHAVRHLRAGAPLVAAHYVRSQLVTRFNGRLGRSVARAMSAARHVYMRQSSSPVRAGVRAVSTAATALARRLGAEGAGSDAWQRPYARSEELEAAGVIYPERAVPLTAVSADDLLLFSTMEVLHTRDAFTTLALERLQRERGVHIAHCYLLNRLPYIAGVFRPDSTEDVLSDEWLAFADALEDAVRSGTVWNPPVGELAEWLRCWQHVSVEPGSGDSAMLHNASTAPLREFTVLLPPDVMASDVRWDGTPPVGHRYWPDWLAVWGGLPAKSSVELHWA